MRDEADCRGLPMHGAGAPDGCARGRAMNPRPRHDTARDAKRGHDRGRQPSEPKPACGELRWTATRRRICIRRAVAGRANRPRWYGSTVTPARGRTLERQGRLRKQGRQARAWHTSCHRVPPSWRKRQFANIAENKGGKLNSPVSTAIFRLNNSVLTALCVLCG